MINEWGLLISLVFLLIIALMIALYPLRKAKLSMLMLSPVLFFLVAVAYWRWGAWPEWKGYVHQLAKQQEAQVLLKSVRSPQELVDKLTAHLKKDPGSARGWYLLGRLYASQSQWPQATEAYAKAYRLQPANEQITVNYAQSLWQSNQQQFDDRIRALYQAVLKINNEQPDALLMLAMDAYNGHAYQQAINYWQRLLKIAPSQSEEAQAIRKAIAKAQHKLS